jgi:two-component system response regulator VicR
MEILIVEDDPLMLKTMESCLKKGGYDVISAMDGKEAIRKIEVDLPDMVITEIMLPSAGGMEIINFAKNINSKKLPVIVLSKIGLEKTINDAFQLGADDFITKPFSPDELLNRIRRLYKSYGNLIEEISNKKVNLLYFLSQKLMSSQINNGQEWVSLYEIMDYPAIRNSYTKDEVLMVLENYSGMFSTLSLGPNNKLYKLA